MRSSGKKKKDDGFGAMGISPSMKEDIERERELEDMGSMAISSSMKEDIERERELEEIGPFSHWLED
jgi:hypothetical protein